MRSAKGFAHIREQVALLTAHAAEVQSGLAEADNPLRVPRRVLLTPGRDGPPEMLVEDPNEQVNREAPGAPADKAAHLVTALNDQGRMPETAHEVL